MRKKGLSIGIIFLVLLVCTTCTKDEELLTSSEKPSNLKSVMIENTGIIVNTTSDVADFGGSQQIGDLPGNDGLISLREAIMAANSTLGPQIIGFKIPTSDVGFNGKVFTITPQDEGLPGIWDNGTTIDGATQAIFTGDTNPLGPEIVLDGSMAGSVHGLIISNSSNNLVSGLVIHSFSQSGMKFSHDLMDPQTSTNNNEIFQCYIGTDETGTQALGNGREGIKVEGTGNIIHDNLISGNRYGIITEESGNIIRDNFVGTNTNGTSPIPNTGFGILVSGEDMQIEGNLISGNNDNGIVLACKRSRIYDNKIGTDILGMNPIPNGTTGGGTGVSIAENSEENTVIRNLIAFNLEAGVAVTQTAINNTISQNSIFSNKKLGIDLGVSYHGDGVTLNDPEDVDIGPNGFMNYPILTSAMVTPGVLLIKGTIDTQDPRTVTIEFFANPVPTPGGDPSGYGEGAVYLGSKKPNVKGKFVATLSPIVPGTFVTATATDINGNTSEFSKNIEAKEPPPSL
jgi:Right handed beta helix region